MRKRNRRMKDEREKTRLVEGREKERETVCVGVGGEARQLSISSLV